MGYFFRKSTSFGPFRLNFSKSGIGASVGVKGARVTLTPRGTTYVTVGTQGFYYRESLSHRPGSVQSSGLPPVSPGNVSTDKISTADVSDLVDSSSERLVEQLNERAQMSNPAIVLYTVAGMIGIYALFSAGASQPATVSIICFTAAAATLAAGVRAHKRNTEKRISRLFYELNDVEQRKHACVQEAFGNLARCLRIWRIEAKSATDDWKRNAGASSLVSRTPVSINNTLPRRIETNVTVPCLDLTRIRLFFLPDTILCWQDGRFGAVSYDDFRTEQGVTRFIEEDPVPSDSTKVGQTWRYVNKKGGPDRRFNDNREIPILEYGVLIFASSKGLNLHLNTSNAQRSLDFANCWNAVFRRASAPGAERPHPKSRQGSVSSSDPMAQARKMLGVTNSASAGEISAAYHRLAQMYHPDKVSGLAPEFQVIAEKRMKEINAAYEMLKGKE